MSVRWPACVSSMSRVGTASSGPIPDIAILAALLAEETSTARHLLIKLGVAPDGLLNP